MCDGRCFLPSGVIALFCRQYDIIKDNEPNNSKEKAKSTSENSTPEHQGGGLLRSKVRAAGREHNPFVLNHPPKLNILPPLLLPAGMREGNTLQTHGSADQDGSASLPPPGSCVAVRNQISSHVSGLSELLWRGKNKKKRVPWVLPRQPSHGTWQRGRCSCN